MWTPAITSLECRRPGHGAASISCVLRHGTAPMRYILRHGAAPMPYISRLLLIAACLLTAGCGRTINRAAERRIRDALPQYIGPARVWRAHVDNPPERTLRGKLS